MPEPGIPRILLVITTLAHGGAERQVLDLAGVYHARGIPVAVAALLGGALAADFAALDVPVYQLGMRRGVADPRGIVSLARVVRDFRPDVVHSHMVHANLLARIARLIVPIPVLISTAQNIDEEGAARELAYRMTDRLCDLTTNVSAAATRRYAELRLASPGRLRHVPNGLNLARMRCDAGARTQVRQELGVAPADFVWLSVGRLDVQKDPETLLRAFAAHHAAHPGSRLVIAGVGPLHDSMVAIAGALGLAGTVSFLGLRHDVAALMRGADGFALSSRWEGLPMVLLEAAGASLPIVATDVGGNAEIVMHGESGRLVPPGDAPALAASMNEVVAMDAAGRARLGSAGRRVVEHRYDLERIADDWLRIYASVGKIPGVSR